MLLMPPLLRDYTLRQTDERFQKKHHFGLWFLILKNKYVTTGIFKWAMWQKAIESWILLIKKSDK